MRSLTPEVPRTEITRDPDHPPIDDWLLGPGREAALKWLKVAMTERKKALHEFRGPPSGQLLVLMFVTMVGWGKNSLCDELMRRKPNPLLSLVTPMPPPEQTDAIKLLESDVLKTNFWNSVNQAMAIEQLRVLVLNRNFPPNSWAPSISKLREFARARGRKVGTFAITFVGTHTRVENGCSQLFVCSTLLYVPLLFVPCGGHVL
mmetsp:Transcript_17618/g.48850  ORF Transcript_17618/g.48850 Transcript_17618/m.48850 type:complete len:204 (-) Transcript_17618:2049-2660(-)